MAGPGCSTHLGVSEQRMGRTRLGQAWTTTQENRSGAGSIANLWAYLCGTAASTRLYRQLQTAAGSDRLNQPGLHNSSKKNPPEAREAGPGWARLQHLPAHTKARIEGRPWHAWPQYPSTHMRCRAWNRLYRGIGEFLCGLKLLLGSSMARACSRPGRTN